LKHALIATLLFPLAAFAAGMLLISLLLPNIAQAAEAEYSLVIRDHRFEPTELTIPPDTKIRLKVENMDATPEEFDSFSLNREKAIAGHSSAIIYIGPLAPGRYPFTGEFHSNTAKGVIVAQ
jgi:hypothetical protein